MCVFFLYNFVFFVFMSVFVQVYQFLPLCQFAFVFVSLYVCVEVAGMVGEVEGR